MTLNEFRAWLEGFSASFVDGVPNADQWNAVKAKLEKVAAPVAPAPQFKPQSRRARLAAERANYALPCPAAADRCRATVGRAEPNCPGQLKMFQYAPLAAYGIRFHGRMWLKTSQLARIGAEAYGWRPFSWTARLDEAEKWLSRTAAEHFATRHCHGPFEVAEIPSRPAVVDHSA